MKIIGHRGARGLAPENTLASIQKAIEFGVDEVEIDVRVSQDGTPLLHHDPAISYPSESSLIIAKYHYDKLRRIKPDLATLSQAIETVNKQRPMVIEVKPGEHTKPIVTVVQRFLNSGWRPDDFLFASFSQPILRELHAALPEIQIIINDRWSGVRANIRARELGAKRITMNQLWLWPGFIRAISHNSYQLYAYVVNDPKKAHRWERYGLYGIITDYPERFHR